jgi:uncharacterized membrane protein
MQDPIDDIDNYIWNIFYFNKEDARVFVPKRNRFLGWTLNFARPGTYLFLAGLILLVVLLTANASK